MENDQEFERDYGYQAQKDEAIVNIERAPSSNDLNQAEVEKRSESEVNRSGNVSGHEEENQ